MDRSILLSLPLGRIWDILVSVAVSLSSQSTGVLSLERDIAETGPHSQRYLLTLLSPVFSMFFQSYPIIFGGVYGFNAGETGLAFLPIGVGAMLAGIIYIYWERYLEKARARTPPPAWSQQEEYVRLPIALLGAPLFAISLFWLGWTARADVHWIVPILSALPFGIGFLLIFSKCSRQRAFNVSMSSSLLRQRARRETLPRRPVI